MAVEIKKLRALFVLEYFPPHIGGVETLFQCLTESLAAAGWDVTVLTLRVSNSFDYEEKNGVRIKRISAPRRGDRYFFSLLALPLALKYASQCDIIHTTTYSAALPAWIVSRFRKKPVVLTVHEVLGGQWFGLTDLPALSRFVYHWLEKILLSFPFDHFLSDSHFTNDRLKSVMGIGGERASVAYPIVDYEFWDGAKHLGRDLRGELGLPADTRLYLYFGRPGVTKGLRYLLEAVPLIRDRASNSRLVLLLAKEPEDQYKKALRRIHELGIGDDVCLMPSVRREELPSYLLGVDCVVVPSLSEGFGYAAMEAALLGQKVVTTSGHSVEEILGEHAVYVQPRDALALSIEIIRALESKRPAPFATKVFTREGHLASVLRAYARLIKDPDLSSQVFGQTQSPERGAWRGNSR